MRSSCAPLLPLPLLQPLRSVVSVLPPVALPLAAELTVECACPSQVGWVRFAAGAGASGHGRRAAVPYLPARLRTGQGGLPRPLRSTPCMPTPPHVHRFESRPSPCVSGSFGAVPCTTLSEAGRNDGTTGRHYESHTGGGMHARGVRIAQPRGRPSTRSALRESFACHTVRASVAPLPLQASPRKFPTPCGAPLSEASLRLAQACEAVGDQRRAAWNSTCYYSEPGPQPSAGQVSCSLHTTLPQPTLPVRCALLGVCSRCPHSTCHADGRNGL
jgi:hypothetical protein